MSEPNASQQSMNTSLNIRYKHIGIWKWHNFSNVRIHDHSGELSTRESSFQPIPKYLNHRIAYPSSKKRLNNDISRELTVNYAAGTPMLRRQLKKNT